MTAPVGNPPTLVIPEGRLPICAEHAAGLARAGTVAQLANAADLEGRACLWCELERFVLSAQSVTTLVMETLEDGDPVLEGERDASVPVDMVATRRVNPAAFVLTFQDGSRWLLEVKAAAPALVGP